MKYPKGYKQPFAGSLTELELVTDGAIVAVAEEWQTVGQYTVPAGHAIEIGYGDMEGYDSAVGRVFIDLQDAAPATITGRIRLVAYNATETMSQIIFDLPHSRAGAGAANLPFQSRPLPETDVLSKEFEHLRLQIRPDDAGQGPVSQGDCTVLVDIVRLQYDPARA